MSLFGTIFLAAKGTIFLAKSTAVKAAILKYGAYIVTTKGVAATISTGLTVATAAGVFVTLKSIPTKANKGFEQIINGICEGSIADFMDGLYKLQSVYSSADSLISDFTDFIETVDCSTEVKSSLTDAIIAIKGLLINEIEHTGYTLLKEAEVSLKANRYKPNEYMERIKTIYYKHTFDIYEDYTELLGRGGRIYEDITTLNKQTGVNTSEEFDHYLVYCIAGWFKDNLLLDCILDKSQKELAKNITDQILEYLHNVNIG